VGERIAELRDGLFLRAEEAAQGTTYKLAEAFHYVDLEMLGPYRKKDTR
jgi:hypothetical protein